MLKPCSLKVGRSGASGVRVALMDPRLRIGVPPLSACIASPTLIAATVICLPAIAVRTSAAPLNGMWFIFAPVARSNSSMARWSSDPAPVVPR